MRNAPNPTSEIAAIISVTHTCTGQCSCGSGICTYTYYSCALDSDEAAADASDACKNKYGESSTASGFVCVGSTDQCTPATDEYAPEFESELEYEEAVEIIE